MTALDEALASAASGGTPEPIALMRILMEAESEGEARRRLAAAEMARAAAGDWAARARLARLAALWATTPDAWRAVRGTIDAIAHKRPDGTTDDALAYWADSFDRLVAAQPEASVALYSLGSPDILAAATGEIVERLDEWHLLSPDTHVLDLGCGIGRFILVLAPRVAHITGLDLSALMVGEAQRRCSGLDNVIVRQSTGRNLAGIADASLDLVLAADVFPYMVESGGTLAASQIAEAARVLRPSGALLILNYSYRGSLDRDRSDLAVAAGASGFGLERAGTRDFALWDGATFLLRRRAAGWNSAGTLLSDSR